MDDRAKLVFTDALTICVAWSLYYVFRVRSGWVVYTAEPEFLLPMLIICAFWLLTFFFAGMYRSWYRRSRVDEFFGVVKAVSFGSLALFFIIFIDDEGIGSPTHTRLLIAVYWALMIVSVGTGRLILHSVQRRLLTAGFGQRNAVIIGINERSLELMNMVQQHPALGYRVIGFIDTDSDKASSSCTSPVSVLGNMHTLPTVLSQHDVKEVLIALRTDEHDKLLRVITSCNGHDVSMKIVPDLYDIVSGQAHTNQIYGFPLIEVMPELMPQWERAAKRAIDIAVALIILVVGLPIWLLIALGITLDSKGPVFYVQERAGRDGRIFKMIKFRSMHEHAEKQSGPVWANKKDPRITRVGKVLRRLRLDEVPQFINVLDGDMSLVGPRPERPFFIEIFSKEVPLYTRRMKVRPGITGWAQVKHKYDETIEDVKKKVQYDLFYIENMSLRMDLKILMHTIHVVLRGRGQ